MQKLSESNSNEPPSLKWEHLSEKSNSQDQSQQNNINNLVSKQFNSIFETISKKYQKKIKQLKKKLSKEKMKSYQMKIYLKQFMQKSVILQQQLIDSSSDSQEYQGKLQLTNKHIKIEQKQKFMRKISIPKKQPVNNDLVKMESTFQDSSVNYKPVRRSRNRWTNKKLDIKHLFKLIKKSYVINTARISCISVQIKFNDDQLQEFIQKAKQYDLRQVQYVNFVGNTQKFAVQILARLNWNKLKCLYMPWRQIRTLEFLKQLNLDNLKILALEWNYLSIQQAKVLSKLYLAALVYLSLSFDIRKNNQCWVIFLENKLNNLPTIERLDIYQSPSISKEVKNQIVNCVREKSEEIRQNKIRQAFEKKQGEGMKKYVQKFAIKMFWWGTQEDWGNMSKQGQERIIDGWEQSVKEKNMSLKRTLPLKKSRTEKYHNVDQSQEQKQKDSSLLIYSAEVKNTHKEFKCKDQINVIKFQEIEN